MMSCLQTIEPADAAPTTRGDESLQVLDVILLLLILLLLDDLILLHCLAEGVVVTSVVSQLLLSQPDDVRAHPVQEVLQITTRHCLTELLLLLLFQALSAFAV